MLRIISFSYLVFFIACNNNSTTKVFKSTANDTIVLIQSLLDNKRLNDSLFSEQLSQNLIVYKDSRIPTGAAFTYQGKSVIIKEEMIGKRYINFEHPRFIIAFANVKIKNHSAILSFEMPDVGIGVSTNWKRNRHSDPWQLIDWSTEYY